MGCELHGESVDQAHEAHCRHMRVGTREFSVLVSFAQNSLDEIVASDVELLTDASHQRISQSLAPCVDPQHPLEVIASFRNEIFDGPSKLFGGRWCFDDVFLALLKRFSRVVGKSFGKQGFLGLEVVVNETVRHAETLCNVRHARSGKASFDHDPAGRLENVHPSLFDGLSLHSRKHSLTEVNNTLTMTELKAESLRFGRLAYLATVSRSGTPYLSPVTVSWNGDVLLAFVASREAKVKNLRSEPRICVHFGVGADTDWDSCILWGLASIVDDTEGRRRLWDKMGYDCNLFEPGGPSADTHVFVEIEPHRAVILRNYGIKGSLSWRR